MLDMAIVGGGPAGLATGIWAAESGLSAAVFERRNLPLDKACGEGVMPPGVRLLKEMGVRVPLETCASFRGIRYVDGETVAEGSFPSAPGWGIRRTVLIGALVERASELGVGLHYGERVRGWEVCGEREVVLRTDERSLRAHYLVGADGVNSPVRQRLRLERPSRRTLRYGTRRHYRIEPWSPFVEVHWAAGVEAYVTPVGAQEVGVALLFRRGSGDFQELLGRFPLLGEKLRGAAATSSVRASGPFHHRVATRHRGPVVLVGDAAGYADALTGEGLSLAFGAARALANAVHAGDLSLYEASYRKLSRTYYRMTGMLLRIADRPRLRRCLVRGLARDRKLFDGLLAVLIGEASWRALGLRRCVRLLGNLLC